MTSEIDRLLNAVIDRRGERVGIAKTSRAPVLPRLGKEKVAKRALKARYAGGGTGATVRA